MIEFDKLEEAYDLAHKTNHSLSTEIRMIEGAYACAYHLLNNIHKTGGQYFNLDSLLAKLYEAKHPKSKYKVGQTVWRLNNDEYEPHSLVICDIDMSSDETYLDGDDGSWWMEEQLYESRNALIEAQIFYWVELLAACEHESDCIGYTTGGANGPWHEKCKKCGEFYR